MFQVVDCVDLFRDRVEIHVNVKMEMFKQGLSGRLVVPTETVELTTPEAVEDAELVTTPSVLVPQYNNGDVNCTSLAV